MNFRHQRSFLGSPRLFLKVGELKKVKYLSDVNVIEYHAVIGAGLLQLLAFDVLLNQSKQVRLLFKVLEDAHALDIGGHSLIIHHFY